MALLLTGCGRDSALAGTTAPALPARIAPGTAAGVSLVQEPQAERAFARAGKRSLVAAGRVFTLREGSVARGDLQVVAFKPRYSARLRSVQDGVLSNIGGRNFRLVRLGGRPVHVASLPSRQILVWFSPDGSYYSLIDVEASFARAQDVFLAILDHQEGRRTSSRAEVAPVDPRRGADYPKEG
jgi:hypothetical protein